MIRFNYTQVKDDFQSIFNLHELLVTLAVQQCPCDSSFDFMLKTLADAAAPATLFPDFTSSADFLVALFGSFRHYASYDLADRSVNGQNCRKSALLSMMLLRHKLAIKSKDLTAGQKQQLFEPLIKEYCGLFNQVASLTFDLGPYLTYLDDISPVLATFAPADDPLRALRTSLNHHRLSMLAGKPLSVQTLQDEYF